MFCNHFSHFVSLTHLQCSQNVLLFAYGGTAMGDFKRVFKELRIKNGYTQDSLADTLGLSRSTISMYENGNREPDFETLEKIADLFNVDMDFLLGRSRKTTVISSEEKTDDFARAEQLIARNGKNMSKEQKLRLIQLLSEID